VGDASATCEYGLSVARFDVVEISTTDRFDEFAVDKISDLEWLGAHAIGK
jgi:hypothetical protein